MSRRSHHTIEHGFGTPSVYGRADSEPDSRFRWRLDGGETEWG